MIFTIAEVSKLIGLSKVSIYKKLKLKELESHLSKEHGITYIDEIGFNLIKDSLNLNYEFKTEVEPKDIDNALNSGTVYRAQSFNIKDDYINTLKEQLKEKDSQIKNLTTSLSKAQELHQNTQVLLKNQQEKPYLLEEHIKEFDDKLIKVKENMLQRKEEYNKEEKKAWFEKLFRK